MCCSGLAKEGVAGAAERLQALKAHGGWDIGVLDREEHAGSNMDRKTFDGDVSDPSNPSS